MPWMKVKEGDKVKVYKKGEDGKPVGSALGTHDSEKDADAQIAALHANVDDSKKAESSEADGTTGEGPLNEPKTEQKPAKKKPKKGSKDWDELGGLPESMGKLDPDDPRVQYNPIGGLNGGGKACANCQWFIPGYMSGGGERCQVVEGPIFPTGLSNLWLARQTEQPEQEPMPVVIVGQDEKQYKTSSTSQVDIDAKTVETIERSPSLIARLKSLLGIADSTAQQTAKALQLQFGAETGFKAIGDNRWVAWWTNNFQDKHKEIFPAAAIDRFIERCDKEELPMPELWHWHMYVPHGKADWLGRIDHLSLATGTFYDTQVAQAMKKEYQSKDYAVSHGYLFLKEEKDADGVYQDFYTYEISPLPMGKEANPITWFGVKEQMNTLTPEKKAHLEAIVGVSTAAALIQAGEEKSKQMEALGIKFKELGQGEAQSTETGNTVEAGNKEILQAFKEVADRFTVLEQKIVDLTSQNKEREERLVALESFLKESFALQPRASRAAQTVLDQSNPYLVMLGKNELAQQAKANGTPEIGGVLGQVMKIATEQVS